MMLSVYIDGNKYLFPKDLTILNACQLINKTIPKFCFDRDLEISGNCRMCLVEIKGSLNPVVSCTFKIFNNIQILTNSPLVKKARENILEFLLINHPLDCPVCDQGGECDLQDLSLINGSDKSRYFENKKTVENLKNNFFIKTVMTRCILCTKCTRFGNKILSSSFNLGVIGRGRNTEIGFYVSNNFISEFSANVVDLCPVGALTLKPSEFTTRNWYTKKYYSFDVLDNTCSDIIVHVSNNKIIKITPNLNLNVKYISNLTRFFFDSIYYNRIKNPYLSKKKNIKLSWDKVFKILKFLLRNNDYSCFKFILGEFIDCNSIFMLYNFLNNSGISNIEYYLKNNYKVEFDFNSKFLINKINNNSKNKLYLLVGCNLREENSSLNLFLNRNVNNNMSGRVYTIGSNNDLLFKTTNLGISFKTFIKILEGKHFFCKKLKNSKNPVIIFGEEFYSTVNNFFILDFIKKKFINFKIINIFKENNFFNFLEIFGKIDNKKIVNDKILYLYNTKNFLKNKKYIKKYSFIVYYGHHLTSDALLSDLVIPCNTFFEKKSIYINYAGEIKKNKKIINNYFFKNYKLREDDWFFKILDNYSNQKNKPLAKKTFNYLRDTSLFITRFNSTFILNFNIFNTNTFKNKKNNEKKVLESFSYQVLNKFKYYKYPLWDLNPSFYREKIMSSPLDEKGR